MSWQREIRSRIRIKHTNINICSVECESKRKRERERERVAVSNDYYHSYLHCMKQMISKPREWWNPLSNSHSIDNTPSVKKSARRWYITKCINFWFVLTLSLTLLLSLSMSVQPCHPYMPWSLLFSLLSGILDQHLIPSLLQILWVAKELWLAE